MPATAPAQFDAAMDAAVRAFQQQQGLNVDGIVGPETFRRLEEVRWRLGDRVLSYSAGHMLIGEDALTTIASNMCALFNATPAPLIWNVVMGLASTTVPVTRTFAATV